MMNPEEMRLAIAEMCGVPLMTPGWVPTYNDPDNSSCAPCAEPAALPDYLNDLNAMHEAEKILEESERADFADCISVILGLDGWTIWNEQDAFRYSHATAAQRAEAFCRVFWPEKFK